MNRALVFPILFVFFIGGILGSERAGAQQADKQVEPNTSESSEAIEISEPTEAEAAEEVEQQEQRKEALEQLREIQDSLREKVAKRRNLRLELRRAGDNPPESLTDSLNEVNQEIDLLEKTFEQIATGGIDLSVLGVEEKKFDWREELLTIVKPILENLRGLTEKPRQIESLKRIIEEKEAAQLASREALLSIKQLSNQAKQRAVVNKLAETEAEWLERSEDLSREIQLAKYQLENLEGKHTPWLELVGDGLKSFAQGRGLTIVLAIVASLLTWALMTGVLLLARRKSQESHDRTSKLRFRLAAYGYRLLTGILIAVSIMMVFYFRQDLLLMAVMAIVLVGLLLALKNLLPQYITESRLLLNIGPVRERELVMYRDIPWQVMSINMFTRFANPELQGHLRVPLREMHEMLSRPISNQVWFPSSKGDWVLDHDDAPHEIMSQTVEMVEMRSLDGLTHFMPTSEYYQAGFVNLSKAEQIRITQLFGIDYETQTYNVVEIERAFIKGVKATLGEAEYADHVRSVNCEFHSAGDSSLNYLLIVRVESEAAEFYNRIKRQIQRGCVMTCNDQGWGIPFPQLSVHLPDENPKPNQE